MKQKITIVEEAWFNYQQKLLSFIRSKVKTAAEAEDILSDVFLKLTKSVDGSIVPDNISAWLFRVTKNSIIDYYRSKTDFDSLPENLTKEVESSDTIKELSMCMLPMIQALPETYKHPLMLSEIEGKKYKEVALELDLSIPAVKSRILRGREKLHKSLISCCQVYRNEAGETVGYNKKQNNFCNDC